MSGYLFWWKLRDAARSVFAESATTEPTPEQRQTLIQELEQYCGHGTVPLAIDKNGATDMYQTGKAAGRLEVLLYLRQILTLDDEQLLRMKELEDEQSGS